MKLGSWGRPARQPARRTSVTVQLAPTQNKHPTSAEMWVNCPIPHRINHNLSPTTFPGVPNETVKETRKNYHLNNKLFIIINYS